VPVFALAPEGAAPNQQTCGGSHDLVVSPLASGAPVIAWNLEVTP